MNQNYSNVPVSKSQDSTVQAFDSYMNMPVEINSSVLAAMKGYFTNRDFKNISFAEINAELSTAGVETEIKRMEISSSVLRLFIEGHYSLYDKTNIFLQVPLSNLMRKSRLLKPENIGTDTRLGPCVNFNIKTDKEGKLKLSLAPWKLLRF